MWQKVARIRDIVIPYQVHNVTILNIAITFIIKNTQLNSKQFILHMINVQYSLMCSFDKWYNFEILCSSTLY